MMGTYTICNKYSINFVHFRPEILQKNSYGATIIPTKPKQPSSMGKIGGRWCGRHSAEGVGHPLTARINWGAAPADDRPTASICESTSSSERIDLRRGRRRRRAQIGRAGQRPRLTAACAAAANVDAKVTAELVRACDDHDD